MKTLIFVGSPRKQGDTMSLVNLLCEELQGEVKIVYAYDCHFSGCLDCRYCWKNEGCALDDGMQEIYDYIQNFLGKQNRFQRRKKVLLYW